MKRSGPAPEDYITPILRRLWSTANGHRQEDLAALLGCDRTRIAHQLAGRQAIPAHELEVWCDFFGTTEPLDAVARRLGSKVVPEERHGSVQSLERGAFALFAAVGEVGRVFADGQVEPHEIPIVRSSLRATIETGEALLAKIPEAS